MILRNDSLIEEGDIPLGISLRLVVTRRGLSNVRQRGRIVLLGGGNLRKCQSEARSRRFLGDFIIAGVDLDQQLARLYAVVILRMNGYDSTVDTRAERIDVTIDLRVIGRLVRLQIIPDKGRDRRQRENQ